MTVPAATDTTAWRALLDDPHAFAAARRALGDGERIDLRGIILHNADLTAAHLARCDLSGADLRGCRLSELLLVSCRLQGTRLDGVELVDPIGELEAISQLWQSADTWNAWRAQYRPPASLMRSDFSGAVFDGHDLREMGFDLANFQGTDLRQAVLGGNRFSRARMANVDLRGNEVARCTFEAADLSGARFDGCQLRFVQMTRARAPRVSLVAASLEVCSALMADLTQSRWDMAEAHDFNALGADFSGASLRGTRFSACELSETDFSGCDLAGATFDACGLRDVRLHDARSAAAMRAALAVP